MRDSFRSDDTSGSATATVWLSFQDAKGAFRGDYCLPGKVLLHAACRNSGGVPGEDVYFLSEKNESGGSAKNWSSIIPTGSVIRLSNIPWTLLDSEVLPPNMTLEFLRKQTVDKGSLLQERKQLSDRIEEFEYCKGEE